MANLREEAQAYEPPQTKNISELESIPVDIAVYEKEFSTKDGKPFTTKMISVKGVEYRLPGSVLESVQAILKKMPNLTHISVVKSGEGLGTKYQVVPIIEPQQ